MRKLIAGINMTLDGFCDHTAVVADDELHEHYTDLLSSAGTLVYGRITYQLMESYWPTVVKNPTGNKSTDEFARIIDDIEKIVFSRTLTSVNWKNVKLATENVKEEILQLKQQPGKPILVGSPSMIVTALNLNLVDEFQLCVHHVIAGKGLSLLKDVHPDIHLKLLKTKVFKSSGSIVLYFQPTIK